LVERVNETKLHFTTDSDYLDVDHVTVRAEIPHAADVKPLVAEAFCEQASGWSLQPYRLLPFAGLFFALMMKYPKTAQTVGLVGLLITTPWVSTPLCRQFAAPTDSLASMEMKVNIADINNYMQPDFVQAYGDSPSRSGTTDGVQDMFTLGDLKKMGFPEVLEFTPSFEGDNFVLTFGKIKKEAFENLAGYMFENEANNKLSGKSRWKWDAGLAGVDLRMEGYRIDFTPKSWFVAEGNVVL